MRKVAWLMAVVFAIFLVACSVPAVADQTYEVPGLEVYDPDADTDGTETVTLTHDVQTILNESDQADLMDLVVFAFQIGILMGVLGFAMGFFYFKKVG